MTDYVEAKPCHSCRRVLLIDMFYLGRPRADGSRHRSRFCDECMAERVKGLPEEERRRVRRMAKRESRVRRRIQTGRWTMGNAA